MALSDRNRVAAEIDETGHPSEMLLAEYRENLLPQHEDACCEEHVNRCGECQRTIAVIARRIEHEPDPCFLEGD